MNDEIETFEDLYTWQAIIKVPDNDTCNKVVAALWENGYEVDVSYIHFDNSVTIETRIYVGTRTRDTVRAKVAAIVEPLGGVVKMQGSVGG